MEWNMMDPVGVAYCLGDHVGDVFTPGDDCDEVLEEMLDALLNEDKKTCDVRRRMSVENVLEKDLLPLLKVCQDEEIFGKAVRLMANLTQPFDMCRQPTARINEAYCNEVNSFINTAKHQCTDLDFLKALCGNMKDLLKKETLDTADCQCLNHCVLLLRNLFHVRPGTSSTDQASIAHQCLISSFFINELDKVIYTMLNHKHKESWTIGIAQLISFVFKDYSSSLLEPDIDDSTSASSSDEQQEVVEILSPDKSERSPGERSDRNLSLNFKYKLQICSVSENMSRASEEDDDFMLEFKSTADGRMEIKLTNCSQRAEESGSGEEMDVQEGCSKGSNGSSSLKNSSENMKGSNSSLNSNKDLKADDLFQNAANEKALLNNMNQSSCLMDMDILVSYLKKFATDIMHSGFADLVENLMKSLLTKYDSILDHSFLMWTVGFFLSFAHQQELELTEFKEVLNLDLFGFFIYEGVVCCEALEIKHQKKQDASVEKHRLHLVVCTLNQMFRALLANTKIDYLNTVQKCLSQMTDLHNLFILLIRHHIFEEQSALYLRDLVQTNHLLMLMLEEWLSQSYIGSHTGFSMLNHVKQFATKDVMAKYGSLLEHKELNKETLNVAVLTMMYHVAGDCRRQDTLMQLPILKSFSEIWVENAVREHEEFKDLIEFVLEIFMSDAEKDPNLCAQNLFDNPKVEQQNGSASAGASASDSGSRSRDAESSMNISSSCSAEEFTDEEQVLIFTWMSDLEGQRDIAEVVTKMLKDHGFTRSKEQVSKYLSVNGFLDDNFSSSSPSSSSSSPLSQSPQKNKKNDSKDTLDNSNIVHELLSVSEDNLIPFLLDKLRAHGFESHLVWLQKQLLEAAYVKLVIKEPSYRIHIEEPVAKFHAVQNKPIPIIPWNDDLEEALSNPYFHLLQQSLGLYTFDDPDIIFPRIPQYLTPTLLVNKARQIGPIESLSLKFDVDTMKENTDLDIGQEESPPNRWQQNIDKFKSLKTGDHQWLNLIQEMNGEVQVGES